MKVHRYCSLGHYRDHLEPIWRALPENLRGESWAPKAPVGWTRLPTARLMPPGPVMVAGFADVLKMAGRPLIYVEHGAGQTYPGDARSATNGSYSGGLGLDDVVLFLGPSETVAARWRERYPAVRAVAVGCPRLDPWHRIDGTYYGNMIARCSVEGCDGEVSSRGWCEKHYTRWKRHGDALTTKRPYSAPAEDRFWTFVDKDGPVPAERPDLGQCWLWTGATIKGYGEFWDGGGCYAHRWSYEHHVGPIPARHDIDHLCFQPLCVRPNHLEPVTHGENMRRMWARKRAARVGGPVVAMTWHWDCPLIPETRSAWSHYEHGIWGPVAALRAAGVRVVGHGHPRAWRQLRPRWLQVGVEPVESFAEVLDRADLLVVDNSSAGPEFASTGRPVVWLNAPWYRRNVEHGGRFWDWPAGQVQVDNVDELAGAVEIGLADPRVVADSRARMVAEVYCATDGYAAERAAHAIREVIGE